MHMVAGGDIMLIEEITKENVGFSVTTQDLYSLRMRAIQLFDKYFAKMCKDDPPMVRERLLEQYGIIADELKRRECLITSKAIDVALFAQRVSLMKAIGGGPGLPTDDRAAWDADAAVSRMRAAAGGPDKENVNWTKYRRGFVWYDSGKSESFAAYKLPFADVINGTLKATWGGVSNAMAAVLGSRGGVDIQGQNKAAYAFLKGYYAKFDKEPPEFHKSRAEETTGGENDHEVEVNVKIISKSEDEQIVTGIVYEPDIKDSEGDSATAEEIKKAAYSFMESGQVMKAFHKGGQVLARVLENYLAPVEFGLNGQKIKKGSWMLTVHVLDKMIWQQIKAGEIMGFSMAGTATQS